MSSLNINQASISRALGNGLSLAIVQEAVGDHKGKRSVAAGAYMAGGSLLTDALGSTSPLSNPMYWGPQARAFSDAVFYTAIEAGVEKGERSWEDFFRNFLYGFGSSFLVGTISAPLSYLNPMNAISGTPIIAAAPGTPSTPAINQPVSRSMITSSF